MKERDDFSYLSSTEDNEYKRFGIRVDKIEQGLSFGSCISYDKYMKEWLPIHQSYQVVCQHRMVNI